MNYLLPIGLAVFTGICVVTQQALNNNLRFALGSAVWPGFVSYFVGLFAMALLAIAMREPVPALGVLARVPWWAWTGGFFGAAFIGLAIVLVPQLGAATFIALFIAGQMMASIAFDHYGVLGLAVRPIDIPKMIGAALIVGGVVLIRR